MPGTRCAVASCGNSLIKTRQKGFSISYHRFPKDPKTLPKWIEACQRENKKWNTSTSHICSVHFEAEDFDVEANGIVKLKYLVVPTKNLHKTTSEIKGTTSVSDDVNLDCSRSTDILLENAKLKEKIKELENLVNTQNKEIQRLQLENRRLQKLETNVGTVFSKAQLEVLGRYRKTVNWKSEDIAKAFAIKHISSKCYLYIRNHLQYPLPHIGTLKRRVSNIDLREGFPKDVFKLMQVAGESMTEIEKLCTLQWVETQVRSVYEFDIASDRIVEPHSTMQLVMAVGIYKNWKQPVYLDFDKKLDKNVLDKMVRLLNEQSYTVVACVCQFNEQKIDLWEEIGVSLECTSYLHPETDTKVYFFVNTSNLLESTKNWLFNTGFIGSDGKIIDKECLENITFDGKKATDVFSRKTLMELMRCNETKKGEKNEQVINFVKVVKEWFNLTQADKLDKPCDTEELLDLEDKNEVLENMATTIADLRCCGKTDLEFFQKGILITISSMRSLFRDLRELFSVDYIVPNVFNNNSIEVLLSQMRAKAKRDVNTLLSPLEALHYVKLITLSKNVADSASIKGDKEQYLLQNFFKKCELNIDKSPPFEESDFVAEYSSLYKNNDEAEALKYLFVWITKKFPALNKESDKEEGIAEKGSNMLSKEWLAKMDEFEKSFQDFHGDRFSNKKNLLLYNSLTNSHPVVPNEVIKCFIWERTCIRVNKLNYLLKGEDKKRKLHKMEVLNKKVKNND